MSFDSLPWIGLALSYMVVVVLMNYLVSKNMSGRGYVWWSKVGAWLSCWLWPVLVVAIVLLTVGFQIMLLLKLLWRAIIWPFL